MCIYIYLSSVCVAGVSVYVGTDVWMGLFHQLNQEWEGSSFLQFFFGVGFLQQSPFILLPPSFCEHSLEASALVLLLGGNHQ